MKSVVQPEQSPRDPELRHPKLRRETYETGGKSIKGGHTKRSPTVVVRKGSVSPFREVGRVLSLSCRKRAAARNPQSRI